MFPIPWQQFGKPALWDVGDAAEHVGEASQRIDVMELGRHDQRGHGGSTVGARFGAGEEPGFSAKCKPSKGALGRIVREAYPGIVDEADKPIPAPEHVVDRLGDRGRARLASAASALSHSMVSIFSSSNSAAIRLRSSASSSTINTAGLFCRACPIVALLP